MRLSRFIALALLCALAVGAFVAFDHAHALRAATPALEQAQGDTQVRTSAELRALRSERAANRRASARLARIQRQVRALRRERATAYRQAWQVAFGPARTAAFPSAYKAAFPISFDSNGWYIVHSTGKGDTPDTNSWAAPEGQEYVVANGSVTSYAPGAAPSPYSPPAGGDCGSGYYNTDGIWVPSPCSNPNLTPAGATALCSDGTYSYSLNASGTCSWHGGVAEWLH
jgi:hypothetical protein